MSDDDAITALAVSIEARDQLVVLADAVEMLAHEVVKLAEGQRASSANASSALSQAGAVKRAALR